MLTTFPVREWAAVVNNTAKNSLNNNIKSLFKVHLFLFKKIKKSYQSYQEYNAKQR